MSPTRVYRPSIRLAWTRLSLGGAPRTDAIAACSSNPISPKNASPPEEGSSDGDNDGDLL